MPGIQILLIVELAEVTPCLVLSPRLVAAAVAAGVLMALRLLVQLVGRVVVLHDQSPVPQELLIRGTREE